MTGHNHYADCTCGWCRGGWNDQATVRTVDQSYVPPPWPKRPTLETYTNPNAFCPVCGASVFFYASSFGGRVFFDELGPPWPKHPCTDMTPSSRSESLHRRTVVNAARSFAWQRSGWVPILIEKVDRFSNWSWVTGRRLDTKASFVRAVPWREQLIPGTPAQIIPLDRYGVGRISWIFSMRNEVKHFEDLLLHRTFLAVARERLVAALDGDPEQALRVSRAAALAWGKVNEQGKQTFPPYVSWPIARAWLQRAAEAGSVAARDQLGDRIWQIVKW